MGKIVKLLVVLAIIVAAGYFVMSRMESAENTASTGDQGEPPVRVEEKYGVTTLGLDED